MGTFRHKMLRWIVLTLSFASLQNVSSKPEISGTGLVPQSAPGPLLPPSLPAPADASSYINRQFVPAIIIVQNLPSNFASLLSGGYNSPPSVPPSNVLLQAPGNAPNPAPEKQENSASLNLKLGSVFSDTNVAYGSSVFSAPLQGPPVESPIVGDSRGDVKSSLLHFEKTKIKSRLSPSNATVGEVRSKGTLLGVAGSPLKNINQSDDEDFDSGTDLTDATNLKTDSASVLDRSSEQVYPGFPSAEMLSGNEATVDHADIVQRNQSVDMSSVVQANGLKRLTAAFALNESMESIPTFLQADVPSSEWSHRELLLSRPSKKTTNKSRIMLGTFLGEKNDADEMRLAHEANALRETTELHKNVKFSDNSSLLNKKTLPFSNPKPLNEFLHLHAAPRRTGSESEQIALPSPKKRKLISRTRHGHHSSRCKLHPKLARKAKVQKIQRKRGRMNLGKMSLAKASQTLDNKEKKRLQDHSKEARKLDSASKAGASSTLKGLTNFRNSSREAEESLASDEEFSEYSGNVLLVVET